MGTYLSGAHSLGKPTRHLAPSLWRCSTHQLHLLSASPMGVYSGSAGSIRGRSPNAKPASARRPRVIKVSGESVAKAARTNAMPWCSSASPVSSMCCGCRTSSTSSLRAPAYITTRWRPSSQHGWQSATASVIVSSTASPTASSVKVSAASLAHCFLPAMAARRPKRLQPPSAWDQIPDAKCELWWALTRMDSLRSLWRHRPPFVCFALYCVAWHRSFWSCGEHREALVQKLSGRFKRMIFVEKGGCVIPAGTFSNSLCVMLLFHGCRLMTQR